MILLIPKPKIGKKFTNHFLPGKFVHKQMLKNRQVIHKFSACSIINAQEETV